MRSMTRAVRVVALTVALGTVAATSGAGVASAWYDVQTPVQVKALPIGAGLNPAWRVGDSFVPDGIRDSLSISGLQARTDSLYDPKVESPKNPVVVRPESAAAAKTAATAKPGTSRTTTPGPARTTKSRGR
jgi:hypothetical protein